MSRNMKIVLGVVVGLLALGCLAVLSLSFLAARFVGQSIDPAQAQKVAAAIADYQLPSGYRELMGMDLVVTKIVMIGPDDMMNAGQSGASPEAVVYMLAQMPASMGDAEAMQEQMLQSMRQQRGMGSTRMEPVGSEEVTIRGQPATLQLSEGESAKGETVRMATAPFEGKGGTAMLMVFGPAAAWDEAAVAAFIASIR